MAEEIKAKAMLRVPVFDSFDTQVVVGYIELDEDALPSFPTFHFALGYGCTSLPMRGKNEWKLKCVAITSDDKFEPIDPELLQIAS